MEKLTWGVLATAIFLRPHLVASQIVNSSVIEENFENGFGTYWRDDSGPTSLFWSHPGSGNLPIGPRPPSTAASNDFIEVIPLNTTNQVGLASLKSLPTNFTPGAKLELTYWVAYPPNNGRALALVVYTWADSLYENKTQVFSASLNPFGSSDVWITETIDLGVTALSTFQVFTFLKRSQKYYSY